MDLVHFPEGGKMQISPKLRFVNQIRNQQPRLRRNTLFLVGKAMGGFVNQCSETFCTIISGLYSSLSA